MEPLVSVIIPFYSGVEWLCEAVQSVLDQTYKNFEIIVVNDGSPEDVTAFLERYGDKIVYFKKENGGSATARNFAMRHAKGDYFALLDSDDKWLPTKTEEQLNWMIKNNVMWSHTGFSFWWPETGNLKTPNIRYNYGDITKRGGIAFRMSTPSVIFNKKIFIEHPEFEFPEDMKRGQDAGLFKQVCKYYPFGLYDKVLMHVRMRGTNTNLNALVRINVSRYLYKVFKEDNGRRFPVPTFTYNLILRLYCFNGVITDFFTEKLKFSRKNVERIAKLFWILPFSIERVYAKYLIHQVKTNHDFDRYYIDGM